jgi:predicted component of viral defense system (DUF524 family)
MATPISGVDRWLTVNKRPLSFQPGNENETLDIAEYSTNTIRITDVAPDEIVLSLDGQRLETERYGLWTWRAEAFAGLYQLAVQTAEGLTYTAWIRVFPQKLNQARYEKMQTELSAIAMDLLLRLDSPTSERAISVPRQQDTSPLHDYRQIHTILEKLQSILVQLRREPHYTLRSQAIQQDWQDVHSFSAETLPVEHEYVTAPGVLTRTRGIHYLPQQWDVPQSQISYDTYENRLLKQFLRKQLIAKLNIIQERAELEIKRRQPIYARYHNEEDGKALEQLHQVVAECPTLRQRCLRWSNETFLQKVQPAVLGGKATQVLLKHPTYSRFYLLYLQFQQRLKITYDTDTYVTALTMRRVSELYEMWSVFTLTQIAVEELLAAGYRMVANDTFEIERDYFQFDVRKNTASIVLTRDDLRVEFKYEPIYPNQSTVLHRSALVARTPGSSPLTPDMAIEVYQNNLPREVLIFDAKYRWQREADGVFYPKEEDLDKMYRYQRQIQYKRYLPGSSDPYRLKGIVASAYVIYPGNHIPTREEIEGDMVGGLPLIPDLSPSHLDEVRNRLNDLLYYAHLVE